MKEVVGVSPNVSADDLSTRDVFSLLEAQKDRRGRVAASLLLQMRAADAKEFLSNYPYTPEEFTDIFLTGFDNLLNKLPEEYELDISITNGKFGLLSVGANIVTKKAQNELKKWRSVYTPFGTFQGRTAEMYSRSEIYAGDFGFSLMRMDCGDGIFEEMVSGLTAIKTRAEFTKKRREDFCPVPLRYSDGSRLGISDAIRASEEAIIKKIGEDHHNPAILVTTRPSDLGKKMLDRQGYVPVADMVLPPQYQTIFRETFTYTYGQEKDHYGKVIFLPNQPEAA